jgi:hypothetical protein
MKDSPPRMPGCAGPETPPGKPRDDVANRRCHRSPVLAYPPNVGRLRSMRPSPRPALEKEGGGEAECTPPMTHRCESRLCYAVTNLARRPPDGARVRAGWRGKASQNRVGHHRPGAPTGAHQAFFPTPPSSQSPVQATRVDLVSIKFCVLVSGDMLSGNGAPYNTHVQAASYPDHFSPEPTGYPRRLGYLQ